MLDKYDVHKIDILGKPINEDICTIVETEPDLEQEDGIVISIEKDGYTRGNRLIRRAEVVVIKN
ncbi:nucleotide exchange factor GrpE [Bacteroides caccae]|nr:nucleotide exchange factor GrpE [Bacteroides caccae]